MSMSMSMSMSVARRGSTGNGHVAANIDRFTGFADIYDAFRPRPPDVICALLCRIAETPRPRLVVDLGSGTGLSTYLWAARADSVIGVEPSADMRRRAVERAAEVVDPREGAVRFLDGISSATGLPDGCADIVTCSQCLHWMEPEPAFAEIARLLRTGGVFAAYDCDWPPACHPDAESAYREVMSRSEALGRERGLFAGVRRWQKSEHLERIRESGRFGYTNELLAHAEDRGSAARLVGLARSQGSLATLLKNGVSDEAVGLDRLHEVAVRTMGQGEVAWHWSYRIRIGRK